MSYKIEKQENGKYRIRVWSVADEFGKIHTKQVSNLNSTTAAKNKALQIEEAFSQNREIQDYKIYMIMLKVKSCPPTP